MSRRTAAAVAALATSLFVSGCVSFSPVGTASSTTAPVRTSPPIVTGTPINSTAPIDTSAPTNGAAPPTSAQSTATEASPVVAASGPGSIVFIKSSDVWIAAADGSGARQVTSDGAQNGGYHDPSQAPDGTIYALRGPATLVALDRQTGATKAAPVTLPVLENGAEGLVVAPDGAHIAYTTTGFGQTVDPRFGTPNGAFIYGGTDVATLDGKSVPDAAIAGGVFPTWLDASTLVVSDGTKLYVDQVGGAPSAWLDLTNGCLTDVDCPAGQSPAANLTDPSISRDGKLISAVVKPYYGDGGRQVGRMDTPPPAVPSSTCLLPGQQNYSDPGSFAPDDSAFAYDDTTFDPNTLTSTVGQGIYVVDLDLRAPDCGVGTARLALPGGAQPDWGPMAP